MNKMANGNNPVLRVENVVRTFEQGGTRLNVLRSVSLTVRPGELVALVGPSGAGKSTLLHVAGLLERADGGEVVVQGRPASALTDDDRTAVRRRSIGFVYQFHHLLPEFSALENIVLPQMINGISAAQAQKKAWQLLEMVGLSARASHRPARLSGGEQQRIAIARALANQPQLLMADEPTGNLDHQTALHVFDMLVNVVRQNRVGALIATHNMELAQRMDRILELRDGNLVALGQGLSHSV